MPCKKNICYKYRGPINSLRLKNVMKKLMRILKCDLHLSITYKLRKKNSLFLYRWMALFDICFKGKYFIVHQNYTLLNHQNNIMHHIKFVKNVKNQKCSMRSSSDAIIVCSPLTKPFTLACNKSAPTAKISRYKVLSNSQTWYMDSQYTSSEILDNPKAKNRRDLKDHALF